MSTLFFLFYLYSIKKKKKVDTGNILYEEMYLLTWAEVWSQD